MDALRGKLINQFFNALFFVLFVVVMSAPFVYAAISWPSAPDGETTGGKYASRLVPTGFIGAFNLSACPTGWAAADGSNGTPDLRGEFLR